MSAPVVARVGRARRKGPPPSWASGLAARFARPADRWATPGALAQALDPRTVQTPALELIDAALVWAASTPDARLIVTMAPQEGKSQRVAKDFPTWLLTRNPELRVVVASYGQGLATRNGRAIRKNVTAHPELGLRIAADNGAASEWTVRGHAGGVFSVGIGGGLTGRAADAMVIDDPIKDQKEADSQLYRDAVWDWWQSVASTRLAPGAPVVLILTRWHEDDLAGRLQKQQPGRWRVVNIPAQADHRPEAGETDPLGREPGQFMRSARGRDEANWLGRKRDAGARVWAALYQGRPSPAEGGLFPEAVWDGPNGDRRYSEPLWLVREDGSRWVPQVGPEDLLMSWDLAFKDTDASDYVVGQVWLRRGVDAYLLDQVRGRFDFVATVREVTRLSARWPQAVLKLVEDKANGPAVISALRHTIPGIVPVEPDGGKVARARAITPLVEAGNVHLPTDALAPWVGELVEEAKAFPTGKNDDQVDALSQGLYRLILAPLLAQDEEETVDSDDLLDGDGDYLTAW